MDSEKPVDRLLPRHSLGAQRPQIGWNVRPARRLPPRPETVAAGVIVDLSLDGALVEVADTEQHEIDDIVVVRFGGIDGRVVIRHRQDGDGTVRYGIQWTGSNDMKRVIEQAVGMVRGHNGELRARWEDARR